MYNNSTGIPLSLAIWLATDSYDHNTDPKHISATSLLKPIKQIILGTRVPSTDSVEDISGLVQSRMGTAIHDSIEKAWLTNYKKAMLSLRYPQSLIDKIRINPTKLDLTAYKQGDVIPIYMELRSEKEIMGMKVSGKFDFLAEGRLEDFKSTSTYTYIKKTNDMKYRLQGSIYRWLNQDIVTQDHMAIQFIFTDWKAMLAVSSKDYPPTRTLEYKLPLLSIAETEAFIRAKLTNILALIKEPEDKLPACTSEDLWRRESVFKYYKNPAKLTRSTKNFTNMVEANTRLSDDGNVGTIIEVKGEVVACKFCEAFSVCQQKNIYLMDGTLKV